MQAWEKLGDIARAWKAARHDTRPGRQTGGGARPQLAEGAPDLRTKPGAHSPAGNGVATGAVSRAENGVMKGADSRSANGVVHGADSRAGKGVDSPAGNGVVKVERWSSIGLGGSVGSARRDAREELVARITDNKSRKRVPGAPADAGGCSSGVAPGVSGVRYCAWHSFPIPKDAPPPSGDVEWGRMSFPIPKDAPVPAGDVEWGRLLAAVPITELL
ncbi:hypothetical protein T484DRAFT_1817973 [Baffinella frigidus]|nr:hypothetical protein T484DRAFT_1817973 [Cryptophyta sp. CCMP2293]